MSDRLKQVLIVDDEEGFLECLAEGLSVFKNYFHIQTAPNGAEAVKILRLSPIDLVLTDLSMPKMDGFELLAFMNRNYPKIPVILMTCYGTPKIEEIVGNMGVFHYMEKPLDFPLVRLIPGRHYRPATTAVFISELAASIMKGVGFKPTESELRQVKKKVSSGQLIKGIKASSVIDYDELSSFRDQEKVAEQGNVDSQLYVGYAYLAGEVVTKNDRKAVKWFRRAAQQGHAWAKLYLGHMYLRGDGVERDNQKGVSLIIEAAEQGNCSSQFYLAHMYRNGDGVDKDENEASKWFEQARKTKFMDEKNAAEQGNADAQYFVGYSYLTGDAVTKNDCEAIKWFEKAARQGHAHAKFDLGRMYLCGDGVERDNQKGVQLIKEAAEQGYGMAQIDLYNRYHNGDGVEKDENEASKWFKKWTEQVKE